MVYRAGTEANFDGIYHFTEKKRKGIFETCNLKDKASSGEKKSGPQPMNNSLASLRHQRGRDSTDPRPANACTNSCANSALLNCIVRNERTVLRAGIVTLVLRRQRSSNKEHLNVTTKSEREEGRGEGRQQRRQVFQQFSYRIVCSTVVFHSRKYTFLKFIYNTSLVVSE